MENKKEEIERLNKKAYDVFNKSDNKGALDLYKKCLKIDSSDDLIHNNISICYRQLSNFNEALSHISQAITLSPENPFYYSTKATILVKQNKLKAALDSIDKAIELNSDHEYLMNKVSILRKLKYTKPALRIVDTLLEQNNNDVPLKTYKGILLFKRKIILGPKNYLPPF